jgi:hypothetical protein
VDRVGQSVTHQQPPEVQWLAELPSILPDLHHGPLCKLSSSWVVIQGQLFSLTPIYFCPAGCHHDCVEDMSGNTSGDIQPPHDCVEDISGDIQPPQPETRLEGHRGLQSESLQSRWWEV